MFLKWLGPRKEKETGSIPCRFCGAKALYLYTHSVLQKYQVNYFECSDCGSLQTEQPYWLEEAYAIPGVHIDVGQAARVVQTWARLNYLLEAIDFDRSEDCVDYGGSSGLLTRLMRDSGYQYFAFDKYDGSKYANYFRMEEITDKRPSLITAFEVFEHFPNPKESLEDLFATGAELIVFSTQFYEGQGKDWEYLVPFCGQHVFFYRRSALASFANARGYDLLQSTDFQILAKKDGKYHKVVQLLRETPVPEKFFGELFLRVGHGTEYTLRDSVYAKKRFVQQLKT